MSESKIKRSRFWLVFFLDKMELGETFQPGKLHVTLAPWFVSDMADIEVIESFMNSFRASQKFELVVEGRVMFGPRKDVAVNLINKAHALVEVHQAALDWLKTINARWAVKNPYVGDEYTPHIRRRAGTKLVKGETVLVNELYLISAARAEDGQRRVAAKLELT